MSTNGPEEMSVTETSTPTVKEVWGMRPASLSQASTPESSISILDWPSLEETIGKVSKLTLVDCKDMNGRALARKGSSSLVSTDSGNEEPPELWKDSKSEDVENWADSSPPYVPDGDGIPSSGSSTSGCELSPKSDGGSVESAGSSSSVSVEGSDPPPVDSSQRRKSTKGSKLKWIPLPLPDLPPLKQRKGRRPSYRKSFNTIIPKKDGEEGSNDSLPLTEAPPKKQSNGGERGAAGKSIRNPRRILPVLSPSASISPDFQDFGIPAPISPADFFMPYFGPNNDFCQPPPIADKTLTGLVRNQIEYYFSQENLSRDFFLRRKMDSEGYLPVHLIASFYRVQMLTTEFQKVLEAIESSSKLEMKDGCIRTVVDPLGWPIIDNSPLSPSVGMVPCDQSFALPMSCAL